MVPSLAFTAFALLLAWGTLARLLILSFSFPPQKRHWVHFLLGTGYEVMSACVLALAVYGAGLVSPWAGAVLGAVIVNGLLVFNFIDYRYFLVFQTHLPFSAAEYMTEVKSLRSSIRGVLLTWNFAGMVLLPAALSALLFFGGEPGWALFPDPGWLGHGLWTGITFVVGLAANTASNSYVAKNLHNPLQYTPLMYFVKTRRLVFPAPVRLEPGLQERIGVADRDYPFLRRQVFPGPQSAAPPFAELAAGVRGLGRPPNVVFLVLESFRTAELGAYGGPPGLTPRFDALAAGGLRFREFYANSYQTRHALLASYCSMYPNHGPSVLRFYPHLKMQGLPGLLAERGYATAWLHNGDAEFDQMRRFLTGIGVERIFDEYDFPLITERLGWGISDEALMRKAAHELRALREPFFASLLTMSNHHPYEVPRAFRTHRGRGEYGRYLDAIAYCDHSLGVFFDLVRQAPFHKNTVYFVYADSSNHQPSPQPLLTLRDTLSHAHQIPLLILADWLRQGQVVDTLGSQVDLPPTVLDLLGMEASLPWVGQSCLSGKAEPLALLHKPGEYIGLVAPGGAALREGGAWRQEGRPLAPERLQWSEDVLLLNRWAIENNRVVP